MPNEARVEVTCDTCGYWRAGQCCYNMVNRHYTGPFAISADNVSHCEFWRDEPYPIPGEPAVPPEQRCGTCGWFHDSACHRGVPNGEESLSIGADAEGTCIGWVDDPGLAKRVLRKARRAPKRWTVLVSAKAQIRYKVQARTAEDAKRQVYTLLDGKRNTDNPLFAQLCTNLDWFGVQDAEPSRRRA